MAENLVTYCVVHQPRRIKLPAQVIPAGTAPADMAALLFDDEMNRRYFEKVARWCYYPATKMFIDMLDQGFKLGIGFSVSFLWQLRQWDPVLTDLFRRLVAHPNCELVGVEPYHSFAFAIDIELFQQEMLRGKTYAEEFFDKQIHVTDTTEMVMNNEIYYALLQAGYRAGMLDGRPWVMEWREPHPPLQPGRTRSRPLLPPPRAVRRRRLSLQQQAPGRAIPCRPTPTRPTCARRGATSSSSVGTSRRSASTTTSTRASSTSCRRCRPSSPSKACSCLLPSEALDRFGGGPLPESAPAGVRHHLGGFRRHGVLPGQRIAAGDLPPHAFSAAQGPADRRPGVCSTWPCGCCSRTTCTSSSGPAGWGSEAEVSAYFTPREWWDLGPDRILTEQQRVYTNFIRAMDAYV